jgi:cytochrome c biogenesis protein CcmG/thiol:disulfide interchange protein DsbE
LGASLQLAAESFKRAKVFRKENSPMNILVPDKKTGFGFVLRISFVLTVLSLCACEAQSGRVVIGKQAPNFSYVGLDGERKEFNDLKGKVVFLRFWADWCRYCDEEMPIIDKLYREIKSKGFTVLAVNVKQSRARARAFVEKFGLSFPVALDEEIKIAKQYNVKGLPMNFVVNREGILKELLIGPINDEQTLKKLLEPYI